MAELFMFEEGQLKNEINKQKHKNNWLCSSRLSSPKLGLNRFGWVWAGVGLQSN